MSNPVAVEVTRGERVESAHRGAGAVVDADGGVAFAFGDIDLPVYPRSAVKAIQALPLVESGAVDRLGLGDADIAIACASHAGEDAHVAAARAMLAKVGRGADDLECGVHWPLGERAARALARAGATPSALHNNCSGKHAGFVCLACAEGVDPAGYVAPGHPVQRAVTEALGAVTGARLGADTRAVDGCAIPAHAIPLRALAFGFARFATGQGLPPGRALAARRIRAAVAACPSLVAGRGRFDTEVMAALGPAVFTKTGAEGVFCAALPDLGLGLAVKADDGGKRAAEVMIAALLIRFGGFGAPLDRFIAPGLVNWNGTAVGALRPAGPLSGATAIPTGPP
ncbi:asparaginase [Roseiarcus fermentans]|uniref:Asparaginase n=1 Tax=Roseiarcus fermentans TaxID=1473586 RepID=A0A366FQP8_9HYPH|nr:asparaginase [Roseiarcus fermentans]RBP16871.1 asparaginase [Roseiarcus fermentans]